MLGIVIIGNHQYLFSSTYQLKSQFATVAGLSAGADVQVGGVHSGTVRAIELPHQPGGKVTVVMDLDKSTHEIIKQDSMASIQTEGLLGNQFMSISFGSPGKPDVRDGEMIAERSAAGDGRPAQENRRNSGQHPAGCRERCADDSNLASISGKIDTGKGNRRRAR